jgi:ribosomal protein S18 acetylase RimI-like enzyme
MTHMLDRPAWNALHSAHASLAVGNPHAIRYPPSIVPFGAAADNTTESLDALASLPVVDQVLALVEAGPIVVPAAFTVLSDAPLVQMTSEQPRERISDPRIEPLGTGDAEDMLALALLTKPGPFTLGAQKLGTFWGVKIDGRLVAMAGQRMRMPGFAELSGLCTHPEFQGRGLGTLLFRFVAAEIAARDEIVFLHAYASNTNAISLYEHLGFRKRTQMNLRIVKRQA